MKRTKTSRIKLYAFRGFIILSLVSWVISLIILSWVLLNLLACWIDADSIIELGRQMQYGMTEKMSKDLAEDNLIISKFFTMLLLYIPLFLFSISTFVFISSNKASRMIKTLIKEC